MQSQTSCFQLGLQSSIGACSMHRVVQVEPHPKDFGRSLGAALDFNFQEHVGMLNQLVGLMGALPVHKEDSPQMTFKRCCAVQHWVWCMLHLQRNT